MKRRSFIKGIGSTLALSTLPGVQSFAFSSLSTQELEDQILVFVFLRGGVDALNLIAPFGDKNYADARISDLRVKEEAPFVCNLLFYSSRRRVAHALELLLRLRFTH